jgi:hypothetical protein
MDKAIEIGKLVKYYRNGYRYGHLIAMEGSMAHVKPSGRGASVWVPLHEVEAAL